MENERIIWRYVNLEMCQFGDLEIGLKPFKFPFISKLTHLQISKLIRTPLII